eukprot:3304876-Rhodomonas_salina.1
MLGRGAGLRSRLLARRLSQWDRYGFAKLDLDKVSSAIRLRARYAKPGTARAYSPARWERMVLRARACRDVSSGTVTQY